MRDLTVVITLTLIGCATSTSLSPLDRGLSHLSPTQPQLPVSATDSVRLLALEQALLHGLPSFRPGARVVLSQDRGFASARVLPAARSVTFYILDTLQIQVLADRYGDMNYLVVGEATMQGDSATAAIGNAFAFRRRPGLRAIFGDGAFYWVLRRHLGVSQIERVGGGLVCQ